MFYKKTETYKFSMPKEYDACLAFKERLKRIGIIFSETSCGFEVTISTKVSAYFDIDETGAVLDFLN